MNKEKVRNLNSFQKRNEICLNYFNNLGAGRLLKGEDHSKLVVLAEKRAKADDSRSRKPYVHNGG